MAERRHFQTQIHHKRDDLPHPVRAVTVPFEGDPEEPAKVVTLSTKAICSPDRSCSRKLDDIEITALTGALPIARGQRQKLQSIAGLHVEKEHW